MNPTCPISAPINYICFIFRSGPNIPHCGTPNFMYFTSGSIIGSTYANCSLFDRQLSMHNNATDLIPSCYFCPRCLLAFIYF